MPLNISTSYVYAPLLPGEIRLLKLLPSTEGDTIRAVLHNVSFLSDETQRYIALSYCWGDSFQTDFLLIEGLIHNITHSLASALAHIRHSKHGHHWLWIDQICINQSNDVEQNQQVSMMGFIYARTFRLLIWLGGEYENAELACTTILNACQGSEEAFLDAFSPKGEEVKMTDPSGPFAAVIRLLNRPWFTRRWIVQEVCLPLTNDLAVLCDEHSLEWWQLIAVQRNIVNVNWAQRGPKRLTNGLPLHAIKLQELWAESNFEQKRLDILRATCRGKREMNVLQGLWDLRNRQCSKDIDRIFAVMGLWSEEQRRELKIDYSMSVEEVFTKTARFIMKERGDLNVLGICLPALNRYPNLPTWVPDWSIESQRRPAKKLTPFSQDERCPRLRWPVGTRPVFKSHSTENGTVLTLYGYAVQTIERISHDRDPTLINPQPETDPETLATLVGHLWKFACPSEGAPPLDLVSLSQETEYSRFFNHFWKTVVAGQDDFEASARFPEGLTGGGSYLPAFIQSISCRKFFVTENGHLGLGPYDARPNDVVCLFPGASMPLILRPSLRRLTEDSETDGNYTLVGECYFQALVDKVDFTDLGAVSLFNIW